MAIKSIPTYRSSPTDGMTVDEFKDWLKRFDTDKDGRISREELQTAIRSLGSWFSARKCKRGFEAVDVDDTGYIEADEVDRLISFAKKNLGVKIVAY